MTPLFLASFLALSFVPEGQALVRFRTVADNCGDKCRTDMGWPGFRLPNDRWGLVIDPKLIGTPSSSVVAPPTSSVNSNVEPSSSSDIVYTGFPSLASSATSSISTPSPNSSTSTPFPSSTTEVSSQISSTSPLSASSAAPSPTPSPQPSLNSSFPNLSANTSHATSGVINVGPGPSSGSSGTTPGPSDVGSGSTSGPTSQSDIQAYLDGHNAVRAQHGATPLTYSQDLASKAQQWADGCVFKHSGGQLGAFGENLAAGTGSGYGIPQAIQSWTDEASQYDASNPVASHFTQVVWKSTTQVGCALQNCAGIFPSSFGLAHFYVCEYSPQGNIIGEFGANVQA